MSDVTGTLSLAIFAVGSFVWGIVVTGAWGIQSFLLRSKAGKMIDKAHRANLTLAFVFKSNHVTKIVPCKVHPNGYLETLSAGKKEPKHYIPILRTTFSRPTIDIGNDSKNTELSEVKTEEDQHVKEAKDIAALETQILSPTAIEGTNCRAYLVYDGVACAVTPEALLGLGIEEQSFNMGISDNVFLDICLNVNPQLVKKYLTKLYDQSTVDGYGQDRYQEGWNERGRNMDGNMKILLFAGLGLCIVGAAMLVAAMFMK